MTDNRYPAETLDPDSDDGTMPANLAALGAHVIGHRITTEGYSVWHISTTSSPGWAPYADWGDILKLEVGWSCGNPFYYGYGFDIHVVQI